MGIKDLNQYLLSRCSPLAIHKVGFDDLIDKTVVIDMSIYLYKFMKYGNFMEELYLFLSLFKYYLVTPIIIFDGKPPPEKWDLLKRRRLEKREAESRLLEIKESIGSNMIVLNSVLEKEIEDLTKKMVKINHNDIKKSKELMDAFGFIYYDAPGEADILCAYLVKTGTAWACLSDDMDMFLYGCPRVLRNLSLMNHNVVLYDSEQILTELGISYTDFLEIAVLSGTDYNKGYLSLSKTFELHNEFTVVKTNQSQKKFSDWVVLNQNIVDPDNYQEICGYFDLFKHSREYIILENMNEQYRHDILEKRSNIPKIKEIMVNYGFIFI